MKKRITIEDSDGTEIQLPSKYEVCPRCRGEGVHDHPAFSNGLTQGDFDEDPDFREEYMSGRYDVACERCGGDRVVLVPDEDQMTAQQMQLWLDRCREEREYQATIAAERRMGA